MSEMVGIRIYNLVTSELIPGRTSGIAGVLTLDPELSFTSQADTCQLVEPDSSGYNLKM